jgi:putative restriction endonuclease
MCSIHHKLFDCGAYTFTDNFETKYSKLLNGNPGTNSAILNEETVGYNKKQWNILPNLDFIRWHREEVFKN